MMTSICDCGSTWETALPGRIEVKWPADFAQQVEAAKRKTAGCHPELEFPADLAIVRNPSLSKAHIWGEDSWARPWLSRLRLCQWYSS
jgi:hypothetical protein